jgi:predicted secreted hydrolase
VLVDGDGSKRALDAPDFAIEPQRWWTSPRTGARYPSGWRLTAPSVGLKLDVRPLIEDQELNVSVAYWEGAVGVEGEVGGAAVSGWGYAELTGYAEGAGPVPGSAR